MTGDTSGREKVATWMTRNGFATGHGDTLKDLLSELSWQVAELRKCCSQRGARLQLLRESMSELQWRDFLYDRPEAADWFEENGVPR